MDHPGNFCFCLKVALSLILALTVASVRAEPPDMRIRKKLIATGWDHPDAERLSKHLGEMEKRPFDGVVMEVTGRTADGKTCSLRETFSNAKWQREWFQASVDQLRLCNFTRFTDNFVTIGANPGNIDWFDDEGWGQIIEYLKSKGCVFVTHSAYLEKMHTQSREQP
jgi:hypothetical protein